MARLKTARRSVDEHAARLNENHAALVARLVRLGLLGPPGSPHNPCTHGPLPLAREKGATHP